MTSGGTPRELTNVLVNVNFLVSKTLRDVVEDIKERLRCSWRYLVDVLAHSIYCRFVQNDIATRSDLVHVWSHAYESLLPRPINHVF